MILVLYCQTFAVWNGCVIKGKKAQNGSTANETFMCPSVWWDQIL